MKILVLSDLHLEFAGNADFLPPAAAVEASDLIVLAGDIHAGTLGIAWAAKNFPQRPVLYVAGNHEYYDAEIDATAAAIRAAADRTPNVRFLDNAVATIGDVRFVGATLWTDFELFGAAFRDQCQAAAAEYINDFRLIRWAAGTPPTGDLPSPIFTPADSVRLHGVARDFVDRELGRAHAGPTVVITHHLPSGASVSPRYQTIATSAAFASRLESLIERHRPRLWIHGHAHDSFDYEVAATRVVCNPMGYPRRQHPLKENAAFDPGLLLEI